MLKHGGRLLSASEKYHIEKNDWLDLSTGINPDGWPVAQIPPEVFIRLPEKEDGLLSVAADYYQTEHLLPVAGSQSAIQSLPVLRGKSRVLLPDIGYREHQYQWHRRGHDVLLYGAGEIDEKIRQADVLVVINPNNPGGDQVCTEKLLDWHGQLQKKGGWLIVDEAFMDTRPDASILPYSGRQGLIVLRSIGKFFGLAGIRSGFVFGDDMLLSRLDEQQGPWALSHVARYITAAALADRDWQQAMVKQLRTQSAKLDALLYRCFNQKSLGCELFRTLLREDGADIYESLAKQGVLVRLLDNHRGVRFGLPRESQWSKLEQALDALNCVETS